MRRPSASPIEPARHAAQHERDPSRPSTRTRRVDAAAPSRAELDRVVDLLGQVRLPVRPGWVSKTGRRSESPSGSNRRSRRSGSTIRWKRRRDVLPAGSGSSSSRPSSKSTAPATGNHVPPNNMSAPRIPVDAAESRPLPCEHGSLRGRHGVSRDVGHRVRNRSGTDTAAAVVQHRPRHGCYCCRCGPRIGGQECAANEVHGQIPGLPRE